MRQTFYTIIGRFDAPESAVDAYNELEHRSDPATQVALVALAAHTETINAVSPDEAPVYATAGAALGGWTGLQVGVIGVTIPAVGPTLAAGPIGAALVGAGVGVVTGTTVGAVAAGDENPKEDPDDDGRALVIAYTPAILRDNIRWIMEGHGASKVQLWEEPGQRAESFA
jgi:hypothetical protein